MTKWTIVDPLEKVARRLNQTNVSFFLPKLISHVPSNDTSNYVQMIVKCCKKFKANHTKCILWYLLNFCRTLECGLLSKALALLSDFCIRQWRPARSPSPCGCAPPATSTRGWPRWSARSRRPLGRRPSRHTWRCWEMHPKAGQVEFFEQKLGIWEDEI